MKDIQVKKFQDEAEYLRSTVREQEQRLIVLNELELRVAELQVGEEVLHNQINEEMEDNKRLLKQKTDLEAALQQEKANRKALEERLSASVSRASLAAPTAAASAAGGATAGTSTSATPSKRPRKEKLTSKKNEVSQSPALDSEGEMMSKIYLTVHHYMCFKFRSWVHGSFRPSVLQSFSMLLLSL